MQPKLLYNTLENVNKTGVWEQVQYSSCVAMPEKDKQISIPF